MNYALFKRVLIQNLREKSNYIYFGLMPVLTMLILGMVLQNVFSNNLADNIDQITVTYQTDDGDYSSYLEGVFTAINDNEESNFIQFKEQNDQSDSVDQSGDSQPIPEENEARIVVDGARINVSIGQLSSIQQTILRSYLGQIGRNYRLAELAIERGVDPSTVVSQPIGVSEDAWVEEAANSGPTSFQYYTIAMGILFVSYFGETGLAMFGVERRSKTLDRLLISPLSRQKIINSVFVSNAFFGLLATAVVMAISEVAFGMPWSNHLIYSFLMISSVMLFFLVLGMLTDIFDKNGIGSFFMQIIIPIFAFSGGLYFPVSDAIARFSPLGWIAVALRDAYWGPQVLNWTALLGMLGISAVMYLVASVILNKREAF